MNFNVQITLKSQFVVSIRKINSVHLLTLRQFPFSLFLLRVFSFRFASLSTSFARLLLFSPPLSPFFFSRSFSFFRLGFSSAAFVVVSNDEIGRCPERIAIYRRIEGRQRGREFFIPRAASWSAWSTNSSLWSLFDGAERRMLASIILCLEIAPFFFFFFFLVHFFSFFVLFFLSRPLCCTTCAVVTLAENRIENSALCSGNEIQRNINKNNNFQTLFLLLLHEYLN